MFLNAGLDWSAVTKNKHRPILAFVNYIDYLQL
jgi:hypothetical protein